MCDICALSFGYGCETLCFKQLDACSLVAEIGFEATEDYGGGGTEMQNFGIPLEMR